MSVLKPLVSFLTPAYNAAPFIADTIQSVLNQTHQQVEIIVVNDGSKDDTLAVARSFTDARVKVIDQANRGASSARNRGLQEAQGDYIQFLDADDLISPNKIKCQIRRLAECPQAIATCRWGRFTKEISQAWFVPEPFWRDMAPVDWLVAVWERASMMHPAAWLAPRQVLDRAGPWDESLSLNDDGEYFARVVASSEKILHCDDAVSYYRSCLSGSLSASKSSAAWNSYFRSVVSMANILLGMEDSARTQRACCRQYEEFVYSSYPNVAEIRAEAWNRVYQLGGPYSSPQMGPKMRTISRIVGWKAASRIRQALSIS